MIITEDNYLAHYGILRKSGRYPWGSGGTPQQNHRSFLGMVDDLRGQGLSEVEIANGFKITTTQLRNMKTIATNALKQDKISQAQRLKDKGYSNVAIGKRMGIPESSVRSLLRPGEKDKANVLLTTAGVLRDQVKEKTYLDVGAGVEHHIGVSRTKLNAAIALLKDEGYQIHYVKVPQLNTGHTTTQTVLVPPGTKYSETYANRANIKTVTGHSEDGGRTHLGLQTPLSISSKRIGVRYAENGGADADGVIYVRRGINDLSLGKSNYAQVRIAVDGTHYLKGMAVYKDDLPAGVDLVFNTNKNNTGNKLDAMKALKNDVDNPFGAVVRQIVKVGPDGKTHVTSAMNIVNEEGDWSKWSKTLSSQMLSKQTPALARSQLDMTRDNKRREFDEINALTNPTVRKKLLESFADDADSSAVHLKAAGLPRTMNRVILPMNTLKDNEIYAPGYRNGERVALVRHPHGGIFEIPELTVNNRNRQAKDAIGLASDAIGINHRVAQRLSGADFDGDTVLVIPNNNKRVKSAPPLEGLKNFDPIASYKIPEGSGIRRMTPKEKQYQMGVVSNLITDMTIRGANPNEIARAVRHSMVVIDAEKHGLDWKRSAADNGIAQLKLKYQGGAKSGASTLISRAGSEIRIPDRKARSAAEGGPVDKATGKRVFVETGATTLNKRGQTVPKLIKSKKLAETDDARTLSSGTPIEKIYADHSNALKALANEARRVAVNTKGTPYSPSAKTTYAKEVASLNAKLAVALRNSPLERRAQVLAGAVVTQKLQANRDLESSEIKRIKAQALAEMRARTGAGKQRITLTPNEWAAIQAGAISTHKLSQILNNADLDNVKALATPRTVGLITPAKKQRAQAMLAAGYTQTEVADALGVSVSTIKANLSE